MPSWDAEQYAKFKRERTLPATDLARAIPTEDVKTVLDVGCGIGNSTDVLRARFPHAHIVGADNSDAMLAAARESHPDLAFIRLDAAHDLPRHTARYDVVFSNACIQWIPDHPRLLAELFALLNDGGYLAVQTPLQAKHPMHALIRSVAESDKWADKLPQKRLFYNLTDSGYYDVLAALSANFRLWETVYMHEMPSHESLIEWYKGTGLRPFLEQLSPADGECFLADIAAALPALYPPQANGHILFRFPRLFFLAQK